MSTTDQVEVLQICHSLMLKLLHSNEIVRVVIKNIPIRQRIDTSAMYWLIINVTMILVVFNVHIAVYFRIK